jgi:hypothetical protein
MILLIIGEQNMSKVKKQHFVPRFYLNNFTDSESNIYAFDIIKGESFSSTIENIAHQKYFYDYEPLDQLIGREQVIEKALANSEAKQAILLRKLVANLNANDVSALTRDDYRQLADYIITQQTRTPESRIKGTQLASEMERQLRARGASEDFIKASGLEAEKYDPQFQQIYALLTSRVLRDIEDLCDRYWIFWSNKTKHNFYTSDHPVVGYLHTKKAYEIYFPITPRYSVSILVKDLFPLMVDKHQKINELRDPENVKFYNIRMLEQCNRQIYNAENDFRLAERIIKEAPSLRDPNRLRILPHVIAKSIER